jgi:hypothetical protein
MILISPKEMGVASPGDGDLDLDCDNLVISGLLVLDNELSLELSGGIGAWSRPGEPPVAVVPAVADLIENVRGCLVVELPGDDTSRAYRERYIETLRQWEADATPLRLLGAPGRAGVLMEDALKWVVIPRSQ